MTGPHWMRPYLYFYCSAMVVILGAFLKITYGVKAGDAGTVNFYFTALLIGMGVAGLTMFGMFVEILRRFPAKRNIHEELESQIPSHPPTALCDDPECMVCGMRDCPSGEPLHYHHDGCPACHFAELKSDSYTRIPDDL